MRWADVRARGVGGLPAHELAAATVVDEPARVLRVGRVGAASGVILVGRQPQARISQVALHRGGDVLVEEDFGGRIQTVDVGDVIEVRAAAKAAVPPSSAVAVVQQYAPQVDNDERVGRRRVRVGGICVQRSAEVRRWGRKRVPPGRKRVRPRGVIYAPHPEAATASAVAKHHKAAGRAHRASPMYRWVTAMGGDGLEPPTPCL
jgi:hypothetical protein